MMVLSEFQQALIGAGTAAVLGVWVYNSWQENRHRKAAKKIFSNTQQDVLVDQAAMDAADDVSEAALNEHDDPRIEPVFTLPPDDELIAGADLVEETRSAADASAAVDPIVDAPGEEFIDPMIELAFALPCAPSVAELQAAWGQGKCNLHKRIRWIGCDTGRGEWIEIEGLSASVAHHGHVTIQLADRQGAIDESQLREFCQAAETISLARGGTIATPALDEILAHAQHLDEACAAVDIQIAMHVVGLAGQSFAGTKLRGLLEAAGMQLAPDGLFYLLDGEGGRLFSVCNSGAVPFDPEQMRSGTISDITFWLDVPRVVNGGVVFDTMLAIARHLAEALNGVLVDDQRNPLADNVLATIRAKVVELQAQMAAQGIPAGGRRALRLFS